MNESKFNAEIIKSIKLVGGWAYKIPDLPGPTTKKPFDIVGSLNGRPLAIEGKMMKNFSRFSKKEFRPHQLNCLIEFSVSGGLSFVFLNIRSPYHGRYGYENRLIIFDLLAIKELDAGKSFSPSDLLDRVYSPGGLGIFGLDEFKQTYFR